MSNRIRMVVGVSLFALISCSAANDCEVPLESMDNSMMSDIASNLDALNIRYSRTDDGRLCVRLADSQAVARIMDSTVRTMLPPGLSASLDKPVHDMVVERLRENGISFELKMFSGNTYIVWGEDDASSVNAIIEGSEDKYSVIWFEQNK